MTCRMNEGGLWKFVNIMQVMKRIKGVIQFLEGMSGKVLTLY